LLAEEVGAGAEAGDVEAEIVAEVVAQIGAAKIGEVVYASLTDCPLSHAF
jgi:hypothetical protein